MRKLFILAMIVLGTGLAQAQTQVAVETNYGIVVTDAVEFSAQAAISFDFFEDEFLLGPDVRMAYKGGGDTYFQPGVNVGHDMVYAKFNYDVDNKELIYGVAIDAPFERMGMGNRGLSIVPMVQYSEYTNDFTGTVGLKWRF